MAKVRFYSDQCSYTGGERQCELPAGDYRALRKAILERYPDMPPKLLDEVMIAIDGQIVYGPFLEGLNPDSEVVFVGRVAAG